MRIPIDLVDTLTLTSSGIVGPDITQVGADPVWEDDSDATYVDVVGKFFGPTEPAFFSRATANVATQTFSAPGVAAGSPHLSVMIDIRLKALQAGLPFPRVQLLAPGVIINPASVPASTSLAPTTVTLSMGSGATLWDQPDQYRIEVQPRDIDPRPGTGAGNPAETRNWYIYEVHPYWYVPSFIAPPCRNLKRGDRLDLGGARNYPPSKMQQTSSRGVGAY